MLYLRVRDCCECFVFKYTHALTVQWTRNFQYCTKRSMSWHSIFVCFSVADGSCHCEKHILLWSLTIVVVKQVLVYNFKNSFRYVARVESSSFQEYKQSKCSSCTRCKNFLGFFNGRFENRHRNLRIFSEIPANLHIVTVTKHWLVSKKR